MTEAKPTKGPWSVVTQKTSNGADACRHIVSGEAGPHERPVAQTYPNANRGEDEANAALIASAPDLYAALERIRSLDCSRDVFDGGDADALRKAVAEMAEVARSALNAARGE